KLERPKTTREVITKMTTTIDSSSKKNTLGTKSGSSQYISHNNRTERTKPIRKALTAKQVNNINSIPPKMTNERRNKKAPMTAPAMKPNPMEAASKITTRSGEPATSGESMVNTTLVKMVPAII